MADLAQMAKDYGLTEPFVNKLNLSNKYLSDSALKESDMVNSQINQQVMDYDRYKQQAEDAAIKEGQAAYIDYSRAINPYGQNRENLVGIGLGRSGLAETSYIGANNTYQGRVTDTVRNKENIFADINNNIAKARETGNIELARIEAEKARKMEENLWRLVEEQNAEAARIEDQRRWDAQFALQQAASRGSGSGSGGIYDSIIDGSNNDIVGLSPYAQQLLSRYINTMSNNRGGGVIGNAIQSTGNNLNTIKATINSQRQQGLINDNDVRILMNQL